MAGLVAAARIRELGGSPAVLEKGTRPGGSMRLSSCVIWRYRTLERFRSECPDGDPELQALVFERLEAGLAWLEALGARVVARETANPRTLGWRFDPEGLTTALVRAAGKIRLETPLPRDAEPPVVLATGGFPARLARERGLPLRANPWSEGDGLEFARARGAGLTAGMDEFYGRAMPLPPFWGEAEYVRYAQLYGRHAAVVDEDGERIDVAPEDWSENALVQEIARRGGSAWFLVDPTALGEPTPYGTVAEAIERVRRAGGEVEDRDGRTAVHVGAAVTHTIGGLRVDTRARVLHDTGAPIPGLYAAGVDAGGISNGGYASGLAAALVLGRVAAESAYADWV
jgi:fumarate reductase flavoprotein subunit